MILRYRDAGRPFANACGLYPTAALVQPEHLRRGLELLEADATLTTVVSIQRFSFPIQRALAVRAGRIPMLWPENADVRSQDLEPTFHDAGQWYWMRTEAFVRTRQLMGPDSAGLVVSSHEAQDIDNEEDWIMAELKHRRLVAEADAAGHGRPAGDLR